LALGALVGLGGCGLIDSDITDVALSLPEREITVDTADWQLAGSATMPTIACSGEREDLCSDATAELCAGEGCAGACVGATCELQVEVSLWNTFDLAAEAPELQQIDGHEVVSATIDRVWFEISENSLSVDTPVLEVGIAPQSVMNLSDAEVIGTIPAIAAGTAVEEGDVALSSDGARILSDHIKAYSTPFNLIVGTNLSIGAGVEIPTGRMVAVVHVEGSVGL
jgi:hypothetical protein